VSHHGRICLEPAVHALGSSSGRGDVDAARAESRAATAAAIGSVQATPAPYHVAMDMGRRIAALQNQIAEANGGRPSDFKGWRERTTATVRTVLGADHPALKELEGVGYGLIMFSSSTPDSAWDQAQEEGVQTAIAILEGAIHGLQLSGPVGPTIDTSAFHPWIAGAVAGLWDNGHHRQAVDEATRALEIRLKALVGSHQTGTPLVTDAFSPAPPKAGEKRLRFKRFEEGTPAWTNAQEGAMAFARGCMMRIRNLLEHDELWDEGEALESLAALSLLARWTESATVIEGKP
jgi:hypothetical protein